MKKTFKAMLAVISAVALLAFAVSASAAPTPTGLVTGIFTNATFASSNSLNRSSSTPFWVKGGTTTNVNSQWVRVFRGRGFAFYPLFAGTNAASTGTNTFLFDLSPDGTNASTTTTLSATFAGNGLTGVQGYTNFGPDLCDNAYAVRLRSIANNDQSTNYFAFTNNQYVIIP
jgi:hypothetical protein